MKFIGITLIVAAVFLVIAVLLQSGKEKGMSSALGGASSDTYYGKNKGNSRDYILNKLTIVVAIIFALLVIVSFVIQKDEVFETGWKDFQEGMKDTTTVETTPGESTTAGDTTTPETTTVPDTTTGEQ
ncbi:MAG: preprotein translocase subunit SecG [Ruminococcaceae bacterium]|nr:preprotein translocase subunit SecG [Oscillospiraceae bacterium]